MAKAIHDEYMGGYNEVNYRWAAAALAAAREATSAIDALLQAVAVADRIKHLPTLCKAHERLAQRYATSGRSRRRTGISSSSSRRRRSVLRAVPAPSITC